MSLGEGVPPPAPKRPMRVRRKRDDEDEGDIFPPGAPIDDDPRPEVLLSYEMHDVVDKTIDAWMPRDPNVYTRSGELVTVVNSGAVPERDDEDGSPRPIFAPKTPRVHNLSLAGLSNRLSRAVRFCKRTPKGARVRCMPTPRLVAELAARGEWGGASELVGIAETPFLRPDGTICQIPGFDPATGYLYVPTTSFPPVPQHPTRSEAEAALALLREPFVDFPFATPAQSVVPVAAILTMLARPGIHGSILGVAISAATRGSGKSLLADTVAVISTGRSASRTTFPEDDIELEKVLGAYALAGSRLILLDNVTRRFGGGPLDKVLTARDDVDLRVLGVSEIKRVPWTALVMCSGNNLTFGEDTLRRMLLCRLESDLENPETRTGFSHHPLLGWLEANRERFVTAALTVLRAWTCKKLDPIHPLLGSFYEWSAIVPQAIAFAGGPNVMEARPAAELAGDDVLSALAVVLQRLPALSSKSMSARHILDALYPRPKHDEPPDGWDDLCDAFEALGAMSRGQQQPSPKALTQTLVRHAGRVLDGRRLKSSVNRDSVRLFWVEAVASRVSA
jgi:putative DNA primase/helicase